MRYHDEEWGVPVHDDRRLFEFLMLEGAQAGLSWSTILNKRAGYREAFAEFDPAKVARFNTRKVEQLLKFPGIVRNRLKIESAIRTRAVCSRCRRNSAALRDTLALRRRQADRESPRDDQARSRPHRPSRTRFSKDLKQRGFKFVGTTIMYAHMQATGMVNDHLVTCFRYKELTSASAVVRLCVSSDCPPLDPRAARAVRTSRRCRSGSSSPSRWSSMPRRIHDASPHPRMPTAALSGGTLSVVSSTLRIPARSSLRRNRRARHAR